MKENYWIILGVIALVLLVVWPFARTSLKTSRRLKKGQLAHHVDMLLDPNGFDRDTALLHYKEIESILCYHFLWKLSLADVGYKYGLAALWCKAEDSVMRHRRKEVEVILTAPHVH
jgi:hypothetical protein